MSLTAIIDGIFVDAREHYMALGRSEGRLPHAPRVDVYWYAKRYLENSDARRANAKFRNDHFIRFGYVNGALPVPPR